MRSTEITLDVYPYEILGQLDNNEIIDYVKENKLLELKTPKTSIDEIEFMDFLYQWLKITYGKNSVLSKEDMKIYINEIINDNFDII